MTETNAQAPRILVTRLSHIGDCVLTLPMVCAIKRAMPNAWISWAIEAPAHKLLTDHPCVDQFIVVPKDWMKKPLQWARLGKQLRQLNIDIVLDPQSLNKSSLLGKKSKAPIRIGFDKPHGREFSKIYNTRFVKTQNTHLVDRTLDLLSHPQIGIESPEVKFRLPIQNEDLETVEKWTRQNSLNQFFTINPGASWESKRWVPRRFGYVAKYVERAFGIRSVVTWSGDQERAMAEAAVEQSQGCAILAPPTSLGELAALLRGSKSFIGCDTGPLHIAAAVETRCIGLYGPTLPNESGAYGEQHIAVQRWHQSDRKRKKAKNLAMRDITVDDVCVAVDALMTEQQIGEHNTVEQHAA